MKKIILWGTVVLGIFGIMLTSPTTANAATWHHGVPTFLKSGFWTLNKPKKIYFKFSNQAIYYLYQDEEELDAGVTKNPIFKKNGKVYVIDNKITKDRQITLTIHKTSQNKAIFDMRENGGYHHKTHMTRINKLT